MRPRHLLTVGLLSLLTACGGSDPEAERSPMLVIGEGENAPATSLHQMPTPNELFVQVRSLSGEGDRRYLNPASQVDRYASLTSRALNFGVYSTDLVYASSFGLNVEVARYYLATKKLAASLGLTDVFTDAQFIRLEANLTKGDSLEVISNDVYLKAYEKLEEADMGPVLTLVLVGGWVESMHLMMMHVQADDTKDARLRLMEQHTTLEHLLALSEGGTADPGLANLRVQLGRILDLYDSMNIQRRPHQGKSSSGRMVLGDDVVMEMTDDKFTAIQDAISTLRTTITRTEDKPNA